MPSTAGYFARISVISVLYASVKEMMRMGEAEFDEVINVEDVGDCKVLDGEVCVVAMLIGVFKGRMDCVCVDGSIEPGR